MRTSKQGIELIKRHEGLRLQAYRCPAGKWTIGYGHTGNEVAEGLTITEAEATSLLGADLALAELTVEKTGIAFTQNQFDALVSFVYNVGSGAFARSTLLRIARFNRNDPSIRSEFEKWIKADEKPLPGLITRRKDEADLYFKL